MKYSYLILFLIQVGCFGTVKAQIDSEKNGAIGRYFENRHPVLLKFVASLPNSEIRTQFPILTVISWKYKGQSNNGMPSQDINTQMIRLENALDLAISKYHMFRHAYSRTGNNLKELVYYSSSEDDFTRIINDALKTHPRYPIEITFYEDPEWLDMTNLLKNFKNQ